MRCECLTARGKKYERCTAKAEFLNAWGYKYCEEHKSPRDVRIDEDHKVHADVSSEALAPSGIQAQTGLTGPTGVTGGETEPRQAYRLDGGGKLVPYENASDPHFNVR